jgi:hypothetical protein
VALQRRPFGGMLSAARARTQLLARRPLAGAGGGGAVPAWLPVRRGEGGAVAGWRAWPHYGVAVAGGTAPPCGSSCTTAAS